MKRSNPIDKLLLRCALYLFATSCAQSVGENKLESLNAATDKAMDATSATSAFGGKVMLNCKNSKGMELDSCNASGKVRCGEFNKKEYCVQASESSAMRIWGPF